MKSTLIPFFSSFLLLVLSCKEEGADVRITGQIRPYNPDYEYEIRIINQDQYHSKFIVAIENEEMPNGKVNFSFKNDLSFKEALEVRVNDTVRCILLPSQGDYLKNPVSDKTYRIQIEYDQGLYNVAINNIEFEIDNDPEKIWDYNPHFITPILSVNENYSKIEGALDYLPSGGKLFVMTDGGKKAEEFAFFTKDFKIETNYKTKFINIYLQSRYGWTRHLKKYDIEKLSLN